jgi:hypothetical protein
MDSESLLSDNMGLVYKQHGAVRLPAHLIMQTVISFQFHENNRREDKTNEGGSSVIALTNWNRSSPGT